MSLRKKPYRIW